MKDKRIKKVRLISGKQVEKAYNKGRVSKKVDLNKEVLKKELGQKSVEELPKEVFSILGETLLFIDKVNKMEGENNEDK